MGRRDVRRCSPYPQSWTLTAPGIHHPAANARRSPARSDATDQPVRQRVVVRHQAGDVMAQRNHARAGQGRDVNHRFWLKALDIG